MSYTALYRRWRPRTFGQVVGQEHITRSLKYAMAAGRVAHAYLFCGPRGTGKTSTAQVLGRAVNCLQPQEGEPCNNCATCCAGQGQVDILEIDAASNRGIDEIRELRQRASLVPACGRYRVYIVDEVHMLTAEAFNALLKTLEEPPSHVIFILATTEPHKLPPTILSRCQRFDFRRITSARIVERLQEVSREDKVRVDALWVIARLADGSLRDALSLLDQCLTFCQGGELRAEDVRAVVGLVEEDFLREVALAVHRGDAGGILEMVAQAVEAGRELAQVAASLQEHFRNLLLIRVCRDPARVLEVDGDTLLSWREQADNLSLQQLEHAVQVLGETLPALRWSEQPRIRLEVALLQILRGPAVDLEQRVARLEERITQEDSPVVQETGSISQRRPSPAEATTAVQPGSKEKSGLENAVLAEAVGPALQAGPSLEEIRRRWPEVLEGVRKVRVTTRALLEEGKPVRREGSILVLEYRFAFHRDMMDKKEHKDVLEETLATFWPEGLKVKGEALEEAPLYRQAVELFGPDKVELKEE